GSRPNENGIQKLSSIFLLVTCIQAPPLALFNLAIAVWGSWSRDSESEEGWRWVVWGFAAIGASLSGVLLVWLGLISERPPLD
ncbi:MAG: hypothetical protein HQL39_20335, partial [Alphaproteobacteria bacterium]|nr:hypothetical protein [Alphaproteobacteria bacterium]